MPKATSRTTRVKAKSRKPNVTSKPVAAHPKVHTGRTSEIDTLRRQLEEAQETLRAITSGEVDALVVAGPAGDQVYTLKDADRPYRHLAEQLSEGACTLNAEGIILFANSFFAQLLGVPMEHVIGTPFARWVQPHDQTCLGELLEQSLSSTARGEIALVGANREALPVQLSLSRQQAEEGPRTTAVVFDLRERKQSEQALRRMNQELEQRVAERTAQLRAANEELEVANEELEVANEEQKVANDELAEANRHLADEIAERKRGEALIQSLATIPAESPNPILRLTAAGVLLYANPASAPMLADWNASVGNTAPKFWRELVAEAYASQKARTVDVPIADRIYAFSVAPIPVTGYVNLYGRDITTTVRAQESLREALQALQQAEQKANDLIRYAPTAIYEIDFRGPRFTRVNDAMCQMSGYTREELLAMSPFALLDPDSQKRFQERIRKTRAGEPIDETVEYRALVNEGRELYVTLQTRLIYENDKAVGAFVIGHDVTERKHSEQQLRESEERYRRIIETANEGIATHEPNGTITYVNQRMADMMGYSREEMIGKPSLDFVDDEERAAVIRARESVKEQGSFSKERRMLRKDGSILWTLANVSPRRDGAGNYLGYLAMHTDITERKRAENDLRDQAKILAGINDAIVVVDRSHRIIAWNARAVTLYGWKEKEVLGKPAKDVLRSEISAREPLYAALERGDTITTEVVQYTKDNHKILVSGYTIPLRDEHGDITRYAAINQDITEREQAEEALRRSEEQYRDLVESSNSIIMRADEHLNITYMNPFGLAYFGYTAEELIGKNVMGTTIPLQDDAGQDLSTMVQDIKQNPDQYKTNVHQNMRKNGELVWVSWTNKVTYDRDGEFADILAIGNDIDQMKKAEEAKRQSEALLQAVLDGTPDPLYVKDRASRILLANRALSHVVGKPLDQIIGKTDSEYYENPAVGQSLREHDLEIMSSAASASFEETVLTSEGKRTFLSSKAPYRNASGEIIGIIGMSRDITERKQVEEEIQALNRDLQTRATELSMANKELESFSYSVSHDLRAPLASIKGFANLLLQEHEAGLPDNARRLVDLIQKNSEEMSQLVDGLLRFSRSIRQPLTKQTVDLASLARLIAEDLRAAQADRRVEINYGDLPPAQADPVLLKQVLTNLLSNALKFTRQREVARIEVGSITNAAGEFVYHVRDNGVGFDAAHAPGLFGVFQRFHSEEDYEGTGIGLAIVERIVRRHGGRVWAESEADQGATFCFTLPA